MFKYELAFPSLLDSSIYEPPLIIVKHIFSASPIVVRFDDDFVELNGIGLVTAINFLFVREVFVDRFLTWTTTMPSSASSTVGGWQTDNWAFAKRSSRVLSMLVPTMTANPRSVAFHIAMYKKLEIDWAYRQSFAVLLEFDDSDMDQLVRLHQQLNGGAGSSMCEFLQVLRFAPVSWERLQDHGRSCDAPRLNRQHKIAGVDTGFIVETTVR
ncbi:hypothetical protein EDD85DRAFT_963044 [Armillaria nabsnona]|nr:hypothetical protein EDD85DRAFT_963044 [Armillaria nabsnona]